MIILNYTDNILNLDSIGYTIESMEKQADTLVALNLVNDVYNFQYVVAANEVTINGIVQTSAQMIIDTLSNG